jgi:Flp pilus assembly protein TadD
MRIRLRTGICGAIADYSARIEMSSSTDNQKAMALCSHGWIRFLAADFNGSIVDERQAVSLKPGRWTGHANLAIALLAIGEWEEALLAYDAALALANINNQDEVAQDLRELTRKHGHFPRIDEALDRIEARKKFLSR